MTQRKVIETYYSDINNLVELLGKLTSSYRLLVGSADELNKIAFASKSEIKDALGRAEDLGKVIDTVIDALDGVAIGYVKYCKLKGDTIKTKINCNNILTEIDEELKFKE